MRVGDFRDAADAAQRLILAAVDTHAAAPQAAEKLTRIVPITQGFDVLAVLCLIQLLARLLQPLHLLVYI